MQEPATEDKRMVLNLDGLEQVFEVDCEPIEQSASTVLAGFDHSAKQGTRHGAGMSLRAAAIHYRLALSTLRAKIKRGEIPAEKIAGANGPSGVYLPPVQSLLTLSITVLSRVPSTVQTPC